jgi:hypothetical protein
MNVRNTFTFLAMHLGGNRTQNSPRIPATSVAEISY